jgi:hypothetical protein
LKVASACSIYKCKYSSLLQVADTPITNTHCAQRQIKN